MGGLVAVSLFENGVSSFNGAKTNFKREKEREKEREREWGRGRGRERELEREIEQPEFDN
jgi:hypothetical protein